MSNPYKSSTSLSTLPLLKFLLSFCWFSILTLQRGGIGPGISSIFSQILDSDQKRICRSWDCSNLQFSSICWARILDLACDKVWIVDLSGCQKYFVLFVLCGCVKLPEVAQSCLKSPDSTQVALTHVKLSLMFLCICSVCNRSQWCQNMIRTKKWHMMGSWPCHWRSYHIFISSVISNFAHPQQFRIYFFCTMKDQKIVNDDIIYASVSH